jgi:hypothetical protein
MVVRFDFPLALLLEKLDGLAHDVPRPFIRIVTTVFLGIQENHISPLYSAWPERFALPLAIDWTTSLPRIVLQFRSRGKYPN